MSALTARTLARIESIRLLQRKHLTNQQIADRLGITRRTVERLTHQASQQPRTTQTATPARPGRWTDRAACKGVPDSVFFLIAYSTRLPEVKAAKNICRGCPVRETCLDWALRTGEPDGIWGGLTPSERRRARTTQHSDDDGRTAAA